MYGWGGWSGSGGRGRFSFLQKFYKKIGFQFALKSVLIIDGENAILCLFVECPVMILKRILMTREEFADFLAKLKTAKETGQDLDAIVKEYEHRNV